METRQQAAEHYAEMEAIEALIEPWLYVTGMTSPFYGPLVLGPYSAEGYVKPDLSRLAEEGGAGNAGPRSYRAWLLERAEDAIDALAAAGWQLTCYPRMEFTGDILPFGQTLGGELAEETRQGGIKLAVWMEVNRVR